jgi:hypothetical protein
MTRRFSSKELPFLRNRVPISRVIDTLLELPSRSSEGKLSFACPVCGGFDTSINAVHNLAMCFACQKILTHRTGHAPAANRLCRQRQVA